MGKAEPKYKLPTATLVELKKFTIIKHLGLFLLACLLVSCQKKDKGSVFKYFPDSREDLFNSGYLYNEKTGQFSKSTGDTVDRVMFSEKDKFIIARNFYIKRDPAAFKGISNDSMKSISNFITNNVGYILFDIDDVNKILSIDGNKYFISFGYSSLQTYYIVEYKNLRSSSERNNCIDFLKRWKAEYSDTLMRHKIDSAITYITAVYR